MNADSALDNAWDVDGCFFFISASAVVISLTGFVEDAGHEAVLHGHPSE